MNVISAPNDLTLVKRVSQKLHTAAYWACLILIGSIPGLFMPLPDTTLGSANRLLGVVATLLWCGTILTAGQLRRLLVFHWLAIAFAVWDTISTAWSVVPDDTPFPLYMPQGALLTIMIWDLFRTRARIEAAIQAFLLGGCISITTTAMNFLNGDQARHWEKRFAGSGFDPNDIALLLSIGVVLSAYLMSRRGQSPWVVAFNFLYPIATGFVIVLTGSRGAMLASIPAYLYYFVAVMRLGRLWRIAGAAIILCAVIGATQLDLAEPLQRLGTVTNSASDDQLSGRSDIWRAGWAVYGQHPFLGVGARAFGPSTVATNGQGMELVAHNTYLSVLTELGPLGFLLFGALIASVICSTPRNPRSLRVCCLLALLVWAIGVFALSWESRSQTWLLFALIVTAGHTLDSEPERLLLSGKARLMTALPQPRALESRGER